MTIRVRRRFALQFGALAAAAGLPISPVFAAPGTRQQGLGGAWHNPENSGQGLMFEIYPELTPNGSGLLFGGWFTYDTLGGGVESQRWFSISGELPNAAGVIEVTIYRSSIGRFASGPSTFTSRVGVGQIEFSSCEQGSFRYQFDQGPSGTIPLRRLLNNVSCVESGVSADSDFALGGSWYDAATSGQGLMVEVNSASQTAFLAWYTYDPNGNADPSGNLRWFTMQSGFRAGDRRLDLVIFESTGGRFVISGTVTTREVGRAELIFSSCQQAQLTYRFTTGEFQGKSGTINLTRVGPTPGACTFGSTCALTPVETEGPYPLNTILSDAAIIRRDITEGRPGVPLTVILKLVNVSQNCAPIANRAVYIWQTDKDGVYSGYSQPGANAVGQRFMRGVQITDGAGQVVFQSIYPGWYSGRITHIHFRVFLGDSPSGNGSSVISQIAFPPEVTSAVYNSPLYAGRGQNTSVPTFAADNVFRDGTQFQLANLSGSPSLGYIATLVVGINA